MLRATSVGLVLFVGGVALAAADETPPQITHKPPASATAGQPLVIEATIEDPSGVFEPMLYHRAQGAPTFSSTQLQAVGGNKYSTAIVVPMGPGFEYFIEAFDNKGNDPARNGAPEAPHRVSTGGGEMSIAAAPPAEAPPEVEVVATEATSGDLAMTDMSSGGSPFAGRGPWAYVTGGVGVVAGLLGVVFGMQARTAAGDWAAATNQAAWKDAESRAQSAASLATISFIASGVLTAGGAGLFFFTKF